VATTTAPATTATTGPMPSTTVQVCAGEAAVAHWPLARRAAQLVVVPALDGAISPLVPLLSSGVGGVLLLGNQPPADLPDQVAAADRAAPVAPFVMADQEGGGVQRLGSLVDSLPWPRQMAATMTTPGVQAAAARLGRQMRALGVGMDLAPVVDVDGGPGPSSTNPIGKRSFSADPAVASRYGVAFVDGLRQAGVVPVVKHFPGLGGATGNTDYGPADTLAYQTLRTGGLVANATVPGLTTGPASLSPAAVQDLLRGQLGFRGLVLTDSLSAGAIAAAGYDVPGAATAAVEAGADSVLFGSTLTPADIRLLSPANVTATVTAIVDRIVAAVGRGAIAESRLDSAVVEVLVAKGVAPCGQ
jgi:beta-N-acetylhexosaminidase